MHWYVIHTKPRQERRALGNLEQQGYECYLPMITAEKLQQGGVVLVEEPLFPRYLFIKLDQGESGRSWGPIRSTRGVNRLVTFGNEPARINPAHIETLRNMRHNTPAGPLRLYSAGERVEITAGPFAGIEAVYQISDGESRALVLIELLDKPVILKIAPAQLRKAG